MMTNNSLRIGLALSGGGVRAAAFHLGVLARLARDHLLENVTFVSTVSGGSLSIGLVYALCDSHWPNSDEFLAEVLPHARNVFTCTDLQLEMIREGLLRPWLLPSGRAKLLSASLQRSWGVRGLVKDLPRVPRWVINATAYESGKNWRFMPQRMGDYLLNYVLDPVIPIAEALAASAAYPGLIGPLVLRTRDYDWVRYADQAVNSTAPTQPSLPRIHLWDGGVYDNLGIEALFKVSGERYRAEFDFLIVSDASMSIVSETPTLLHRRALRLTRIAMDQVRSLRARGLINHFDKHVNSGVYLRIGTTARYALEQAGVSEATLPSLTQDCMAEEEARLAASLPTTLRRLSCEEFERIYRHGWEVANCTLVTRCPDLFVHTPASY